MPAEKTARKKTGWYVVNHSRDNEVVRGPYKHSETAGAVRHELEMMFPNKDWNLWLMKRELPPGISAR